MTEGSTRQRRQHDSARHYLGKRATGTALTEAVALTAKLFRFPMAQVNILDGDTQHTIAAVGTSLGSIPRSASFCDQVVRDGLPVTFGELRTLPEEQTRFHAYVGVPITGREGLVIGALCLLDTVPRPFSHQQVEELNAAAAVIQDQLELLRRLGPSPAGSAAESTQLAAAVESGEIVPFYQPVVDLLTGSVVAFEALARWQHPQRGLLQPAAFIPLAEDSDIIIDLDLAILAQAAADLKRWQVRRPWLTMNANLSAVHFDHPDCVERLTTTVAQAGVNPASVSFEVTETVAMAAHPNDRSFLADLRERGFRILLDDFGTGFSTLDHVLRLPIDGIKIDRTVTAALGTRVGDAVVRALVGLAAELDLEVVIEGIETADQAHRSQILGCGYGQGYRWPAARRAGQIRLDTYGRVPARSPA